MKLKNEKGVISLEACIVVPIFVFLLMFFYGFFVMFAGQQAISHALIQSAESLSLDPFATERISVSTFTKLDSTKMEDGGDLLTTLYADLMTSGDDYFASREKWYDGSNDALMKDTVKKRFIGFLTGGAQDTGGVNASDVESKADDLLDYLRIENGLSGIDFSGTSINEEKLTINIKYKQEFMFNFQGLAAFDREQSITVTLWK